MALVLVILKLLVFWLGRGTGQNVVSTAQGEISGEDHEGYASYRGIPYGTPAEVDGRFKRAGLAPTWSSVRHSEECHCSAVSNAEECLQLDVHAPAGPGPYPTLAWLAGGTGQYNPRKLVLMDIIVVVVHHRIGPIGFLCQGNDKIPGNAAVKDVVLALRWVQDNIVAFKGDPAKIVMAGQGLGAAVVEAVTLSPMADQLYHGAILQSGTVLAPWAFNYDAQKRAEKLGSLLSIKGNSTFALINAKSEELVDKSNKLPLPYFPFGMCLESALKHEEAVLLEAPIDLLLAKRVGKVPMIIGFNSEEAYIFASMLSEARVSRSQISSLLPQELTFSSDREMNQIAGQIEDLYFKDNLSLASVLGYHSDVYFVNHIHRSLRLHASAHPVFFYRFSYLGGWGVQRDPAIEKSGAAHSDELAYLFSGRDLSGEDEIVQKNLLNLWTNFVKYLHPTYKESTSWDTVEADNPRLLDISQELQMMEFPRTRQVGVWDDIYDKFYYSRNRVRL